MTDVGDPPIFDVHAHLISDDPVRYPYSPLGGAVDNTVLGDPMTAERFIAEMKQSQVSRAIVVQRAHVYGTDNSYVVDAARANPDRFRALVLVSAAQKNPAAQVGHWVKEMGAVGVRLTAPSQHDALDWLSSPAALEIWDAVADFDATMRIHFYAWNREAGIEQVCRLAKRYPAVPIVLDHLSNLAADASHYKGVDEGLKAASEQPNISLVYSTINATKSAAAGTSLRDLVSDTVAIFGPERVMWGSDVGQSKLAYQLMADLARGAVAHLPAASRRQILSDTAMRIYGFSSRR